MNTTTQIHGSYIQTSDRYAFSSPERSDWQCHLFTGKANPMGMIYTPLKGEEPNWFWRKMQWLCFGSYWVNTVAEKKL